MSQSWRKYGGINQMDKTNNITVKSLVTDTFTIREALANDFEIRGSLTVSNNATIQGDQTVSGTSNLQILDVSQNISMSGGDLILNKSGNNGDGFFLTASGDFLGVNKRNPEATFDIYGRSLMTLNVEADASRNTNILARNNTGNKIALDVSGNNHGSLIFYNKNSTPVEINSIYNSTDSENTLHIKNTEKTLFHSEVIVGDNDGLTLTNTNTNADDTYGLQIQGGVNSENKSIGSIFTKRDSQKLPAQTFLDGSGNYDNHIGFNIQQPSDEFVISINGPTQISNRNSFQIGDFDFSMNEFNYSADQSHAIIVGEKTVDGSFVIHRFNSNSGWTNTVLQVTGLAGTTNVFKSAHCLDANHSILVSENSLGGGFILFSNDGGSSYNRILGVIGDFTSVYAYNNDVLIGSSTKIQKFSLDWSNSNSNVDVENNVTDVSGATGTLKKMSGYNEKVWFIDDSAIYHYDFTTNNPVSSVHSGSFNNLRISSGAEGTMGIAVGTDLAYMVDGSWNNVVTKPTNNMTDGYILDASRSVIIGSGKIYYTIDGFKTYHEISSDEMGLQSVEFTGVYMTSPNDFVFVYRESGIIGGKIVQLFSPNILNQENSDLLNVHGNVKITGNIMMDELGEISSTKDTLIIGTGITTQIDHASVNTLDVSGISTLAQLDANVSTFRNGITIEGSNNIVKDHITMEGTIDVCGNSVFSNMANFEDATVSGTFTVTGIDIEKGLLLQW